MDLNQLASLYPSDKSKVYGHDYIPGYEELFKLSKNSVKNVLEIGIGCLNHETHMVKRCNYKSGNSLRMWRDYFPQAKIYAIDIYSQGMIYNEERIITLVADQSNTNDLLRVVKTIGSNLDIIIDDGSHHADHQRISFEFLEQYLQPGGIYVIEDIQAPYIEAFRSLSIFSKEVSTKIKENYDIKCFDTRAVTNLSDDFLMCFIKKSVVEIPSPSFHILIACGGRKTLQRLLDSLTWQLEKGDAITIVFDGEHARAKSGYSDTWTINAPCSIFTYDQIPNLGAGIGSEPVRSKYQSLLEKTTTYIMHADDDDIYLPGAFYKLKNLCKDPNNLYIAKMDNIGTIVPSKKCIEYCNIGTPNGIIPFSLANTVAWGPHRGGDFTYYNALQHKVKAVEWLDIVIYKVITQGLGRID